MKYTGKCFGGQFQGKIMSSDRPSMLIYNPKTKEMENYAWDKEKKQWVLIDD